LRAFIGILVPENVQNIALQVQKELLEVGVVGKYVEGGNMHVNLSFLDEISEDELMEITAKLDMIAKGYKKFVATVCTVKPIPNARLTRVVALNVEQEKDLLTKLSGDIQKSIGGDVKPPHMTLCRVKGFKDKKTFLQVVEKYKTACFAAFDVGSVQLIKSELGEDGPSYSVIHESGFSS